MTERTDKKLRVHDLAIEITRRCNMRCPHCLRGDAEGIDVHMDVMDSLFSRMSEIDCLTFTGGEPSLNPHAIAAALGLAKHYGVQVRQAYVATNGREVTPEFLDACRQWHRYCLGCEIPDGNWADASDIKRILKYYSDPREDSERYGMWVAISADPYHDDIPVSNILDLMTLPRVVSDKCQADNEKWIIRTGRADFNGLGDEPAEHSRPWAYSQDAKIPDIENPDADMLEMDTLYLSATGLLLRGCDYSYEDQEEYAFYKIPEEPGHGIWLDVLAEKARNAGSYDPCRDGAEEKKGGAE